MKVYDISQEVYTCQVYKGDPSPKKNIVYSMDKGDVYNMSEFSMCAHNGTHIDSPYHFYPNGKGVDEIPLFKTVGYAFVYEWDGEIDGEHALKILKTARSINEESSKRILLKGKAVVTQSAAKAFADNGVYLVGNESQTVGPESAPKKVHLILLEKEVVLLEGIRLSGVKEGVYLLCSAPLNLGGADGAPCRAVLIENSDYSAKSGL